MKVKEKKKIRETKETLKKKGGKQRKKKEGGRKGKDVDKGKTALKINKEKKQGEEIKKRGDRSGRESSVKYVGNTHRINNSQKSTYIDSCNEMHGLCYEFQNSKQTLPDRVYSVIVSQLIKPSPLHFIMGWFFTVDFIFNEVVHGKQS